mmetsp:Transcript_3544/g.9985  ORF Transcript_3544/g.9985 Transcript_3544/m.9985 type:complete len:111 (-) Transcript_3544:149-481(-)
MGKSATTSNHHYFISISSPSRMGATAMVQAGTAASHEPLLTEMGIAQRSPTKYKLPVESKKRIIDVNIPPAQPPTMSSTRAKDYCLGKESISHLRVNDIVFSQSPRLVSS